MATTPKNSKMKLRMVLNTFDGIEQIGCRATGIYKGYHIETTAWAPYKSVKLVLDDSLRKVTEGEYNREVREIEKMLSKRNTVQ